MAAGRIARRRHVVGLSQDRALGVEELVGHGLVEQVHAAAIERLLAKHANDLALVLVAAHVDVAKVALECLEQVQIVGGLVVIDDLEQRLAVDDAAVHRGVVAVHDAGAHTRQAAVLVNLELGLVIDVARGLTVHHGHLGAGVLVRVDDGVEVHVKDDVGAHHHNIGLVRALEQRLVGNDVAQQEAHATLGGAIRVAGHHEQAALLAVQAPVLARAHVVDQRAVVARHDDADGLNAGIHHVGQREVDQAVAAQKRNGRDGAVLEQDAAVGRRVVSGDITDGLAIDHRIIPPSR